MRDDQFYDDATREAIAASEREIFFEGVNGDEPDVAGDQQIIADGSATEGWNGEPLSDIEQAAVNLYGHPENGQDRPVEESEAAALRDQVAHLQRENSELQQVTERWVNQPVLEQNHYALRERVRDHAYENFGMIFDSDEKLDRYINTVAGAQAQTGALQDHRVNVSMQQARNEYGQDFDDAFNAITDMDHNNPHARLIAQSIVGAADPGRALMELHGDPMVKALGTGRSVPFLSQRGAAPARGHARPSRSGDALDATGWGDRDVEADIMSSIWDEAR
jgi:hypothetical protein